MTAPNWRPTQIGATATWTRTFTAEDVESFARISGDRNPLHFDVEVLRGECLVYTMLPDPA